MLGSGDFSWDFYLGQLVGNLQHIWYLEANMQRMSFYVGKR